MNVEDAANQVQKFVLLIAASDGLTEEISETMSLQRPEIIRMLEARPAIEKAETGDLYGALISFRQADLNNSAGDDLPEVTSAISETMERLREGKYQDVVNEITADPDAAITDPFVQRMATYWARRVAELSGPMKPEGKRALSSALKIWKIDEREVISWFNSCVYPVLSGDTFAAKVHATAGTGELLKVIEALDDGTSNADETLERLHNLLGTPADDDEDEDYDFSSEDEEDIPRLFLLGRDGDDAEFRDAWIENASERDDFFDDLSLLSWTILFEQFSKANFLIEQGETVNHINPNGTTPLGLAVQNEQIEAVNYSLKMGADANVAAEIVGEDENYDDVEWVLSPVCMAAENGQYDILVALLAAGGSATMRMANGITPLSAAATSGDLDCVELLIGHGADPSEAVPATVEVRGKVRSNPILRAANNGNDDLVRLLIAKGVSVNVVDGSGASPIKLAARDGAPELISTLITAGADLSIADEEGWSPLMTAAYEERADVVALLLGAGANPNTQTQDGDDWTPLIAAAAYGQTEIVKLLLDAGADPLTASNDGRTAIEHARDCRAQEEGNERLEAFDDVIELLQKAKS